MQPPTHTHTIKTANSEWKSGSYTAAWVWFRCGFSRGSKAHNYHTCWKTNTHIVHDSNLCMHAHTGALHCKFFHLLSYGPFLIQELQFSRNLGILPAFRPKEPSSLWFLLLSRHLQNYASNKVVAFDSTSLIFLNFLVHKVKFKYGHECTELTFRFGSWGHLRSGSIWLKRPIIHFPSLTDVHSNTHTHCTSNLCWLEKNWVTCAPAGGTFCSGPISPSVTQNPLASMSEPGPAATHLCPHFFTGIN